MEYAELQLAGQIWSDVFRVGLKVGAGPKTALEHIEMPCRPVCGSQRSLLTWSFHR